MKPLVSILIPAYNAENYIGDTLRSVIAQTWNPKEVIVVDDGSRDRTLEIARTFQSTYIKVVTQVNQGAATARNTALGLSQGDYIQYLDADDLLAPDKISAQMESLATISSRTLLSCSWGTFFYRYYRAKFVASPLWHDLSPQEWLTLKLETGAYMCPASWLVSRPLTSLAGLWDPTQSSDDDGEYFCRVITASDRVKFVPQARVYYRLSGSGSLGYIGLSDKKKSDLLFSMQRHVNCARSLGDNDRVRGACLQYLQRSSAIFYPSRPDLFSAVSELAQQLGGELHPPRLRWKAADLFQNHSWHDRDTLRKLLAECLYSAIKVVFGWKAATHARLSVPAAFWSAVRVFDNTLFNMQPRARDAFWQSGA